MEPTTTQEPPGAGTDAGIDWRVVLRGALVGLAIAFAAPLPRIRVEEHALEAAFGASYSAYESETARRVPGLW